jgi:hypothetical protein
MSHPFEIHLPRYNKRPPAKLSFQKSTEVSRNCLGDGLEKIVQGSGKSSGQGRPFIGQGNYREMAKRATAILIFIQVISSEGIHVLFYFCGIAAASILLVLISVD